MTRVEIRLLAVVLSTCAVAAPARAQPAAAPPPVDAASQVDVTINHEPPDVQNRTFDPKNPPAEMPPLKPGEAAVTESSFSCQTLIGVIVTSQQPTGTGTCRATVKVTSVTSTLRLGITIWLPERGARKLTAHEEGHRIVDERYYAGAKDLAERLGRALVGRDFTAEAADCDAAAQAAIKSAGNQFCGEYMAAVQYPAARVQEIYDELTDHGRNKLGEKQAIELAVKKQREEQRAGTTKPAPSVRVH